MPDEFFHELVSQFAEVMPSEGNEFSGIIWAVRTRSELGKKEEKCSVSDISSLKCAMLGEEIEKAVVLEKEILNSISNEIKERSKNGDDIAFPLDDEQFARFTVSEFYQDLKKLYILRYGESEGEALDRIFLGDSKENGARIILSYRRNNNSPETDMSPRSYYIKRLYIKHSPDPKL